MKRADYFASMQTVIDNGIVCGVYTPTKYNTLKDLKTSHDFLHRNFKDHLKENVTNIKPSCATILYGKNA